MPLTTYLYDRNGQVLQRVYEQNRFLVEGKDIPQSLRDAVVATEDQRFYHHWGVDPLSISRAAIGNALHAHIASGASTITQQLARNSAGMAERTMERKLKEMFLALRIEVVFSKDEILTYYLNRVFWGRDIYGVGAASQAYFGKAPRDLSLSDSAMLAGIISGPNSFSHWRNSAKARDSRARALGRMLEHGYITAAQEKAALAQPLILRPLDRIPGSHAAAAALAEAARLLGRSPDDDEIDTAGLKITTTVDLGFQRAAENGLEAQLSKIEANSEYRHPTRAQYLRNLSDNDSLRPTYLQGAFVAVSNHDGGILALVGGRNYGESHFNRALSASRQVGSTMKPFVYANAFNTLDIAAPTEVDHTPFDLRHADQPGAGRNEEPDYITVRQAIEKSDNYAAVRTALASGIDSFAYLFERASGVTIPVYPSSALGACQVTPLQLVSAFAVFPSGGVRREPFLVSRIVDAEGKVLYQRPAPSAKTERRVLSPEIAFQITSLLQGVVDEGTGHGVRALGLEGDIAGKTGTTNDFKDSWFVGYTSEVTAGVWIGLDAPQTILPGGFAARLAVPAWAGIMAQADDHYPPQSFTPPPGVTWVRPMVTRNFFFIQTQVPSGPPEYLRDDQRGDGGYLARIDLNNPAPRATTPAAPAKGEEAAPSRGLGGWLHRMFSGHADPDAPEAAPADPSAIPPQEP
jgi:penicillin-binding protein 1A